MKKKLLLINPANSKYKGGLASTKRTYMPLGLSVIAALTPDSWAVEILDENIDAFEFKEADLVGITAFTSTCSRAYEIAAIYKKNGIKTVIGGIHASMNPDEAIKYFDMVVIGEAESVWSKLIEDFEKGENQKVYTAQIMDLKGLPKPRRDLLKNSYSYAAIQTSRGCPMNCEFCSVSIFNGTSYRLRPIEEVLDELETIPQKRLFFVDDNLIGSSREHQERAINLFKGMIERGINKKWLCQSSMNVADNEEVLKYASMSGCMAILIGIEAEKIDSLKTINKNINLKKIGNYEEAFKRINKHKISILGTFIYGMDTDSIEDLINRTNFIINSSVNIVQATVLTPLPGTRLFKKLEETQRLRYINYPEDWGEYSFVNAVYNPVLMSTDELSESFKKALFKIYSVSVKLTSNFDHFSR